jgi:hypothetical protein
MNQPYYKIVSFFILVLFVRLEAIAQNAQPFKVNNLVCSLNTDVNKWLKEQVKSNRHQTILIQFGTILQGKEKQELSNANIQILEYLGDKTYAAWVSSKSDFSLIQDIRAVADFLPEYKINPSILEQSKTKKRITVFASFHQGVSIGDIDQIISSSGASLLPNNWQKKGLYKVDISSNNLIRFAAQTELKYISEPVQNIPLDLDSKGGQNTSIVNMPLILGGKGLRGKGVVMGHGDNCSGIYHIDQRDRTINYNNGDITSHGVLVHGIMAGDGIVDLAGQGMAPDGTGISLFFDAVILLKDELFKGFNATLTNNSYAAVVGNCSYSGTYDNISQNLDSMAFVTDEQLDVFAAGNDGRMVCGGYPYGYYNICGGFQTAKNILTVGATNRNLILGDGSSRGPIKDGRLKPEITAVGIDIYCPVPSNSYTTTRGTSLSCPQVTGGLALLTERYKQLNSGKNPKSDLLKAIAINGASDLGRPGPDYWYGFGFLNIARSLDILEKVRYARNTIATGSLPQSFSITVPANTAQVKVLLYYHDRMASASASKQLVNDLDLTVTEPGGTIIHRPLILDPSASGVSSNAVEGVDRLNNAEQVTINNPSAGNYTVTVSDFSIPEGPQEYVVAYDFVPNEMKLKFPIAHAAVAASTDMYIYWEAPEDAINTTRIEFSSNNGTSWTTIAAAVPANERQFQWATPTINSNECKIRITRGSMSEVSGPFIINQKPIVTTSTVQCPGSFAINWTAVPSVDKYYLLLKKGAHLEKVDSVNAGTLNYTFKGLKTNIEYFVAVLPAIAGMEGFRSNAISRTPNNGTCIGFTDGDLAIESILSPSNGRRSTSLELKKNTPIKIEVRNQDNDAVANYSVSYQVNTNPWKTIPSFSIAANTNAQPIVDTFDFSDTIEYRITVVVKNLDKVDPVSINDTIVKIIKHIPNNIIALTTAINNDFESMPDLTLLYDTVGLSRDGYWDYANSNNDTGRLRTRIPGSKLVTSSRSISMDVNVNNKRTANFFTGTFNLSNYDTSVDEVRFDFDYEMRGMPKIRDSNKVWIRGSDLQDWIPVFTYSNVYDTAKLHNSGTISLREILKKNNQNFSTSTQLRFGQYDTTLIVEDNYGGGLTIDNVHLYKVLKDVQLTRIVAPNYSECDIPSSSVSIGIKNGTVNTAKEIQVAYSYDGLTPIIENIPDSLLGGDSIIYTFNTNIASISKGKHSLKAWIHMLGDDFMKNDTIANFTFYNSSQIDVFPYLQNFETNNGDWYVNGRNASWAYGIPNSPKINKAASGTKVWKTNLNGSYNASELSYLVSPCINTIGLAKPMISFSVAFELERCVAVCDRVYLEYSWDNEYTWQRLGENGKGTNWYNNDVHNVWNGEDIRWHVASFELPRAAQLKLRFVMASDLGTNFEGFALDDIHIFDLKNEIAAFNSSSIIAQPQNVSGTSWAYFTESQNIIIAINSNGKDLGVLTAKAYAHQSLVDAVARQYVFPRSFVVQKPTTSSPSKIRLFITDSEVNKVLDDTSCKTCTKPSDIYRSGITQFTDTANKFEDSSLLNNYASGNQYFTFKNLAWVPYDKGYYAELETKTFGEFWLNDGGILGTLPANTQYVQLNARRLNDQQAELNWASAIDTQMNSFRILRSTDSLNFVEVTEVQAQQKVNAQYLSLDNPTPQQDQIVYYKLFCTALNGKTFYSNTVSVQWTKGDQLLSVYPVPSTDGVLRLKWTGAVGSNAIYTLTDMAGKLVYNNEIKAAQWMNETQLNLGFLSKGMYFLKIQIGSNSYQEKVIFK